MSKITEKNKIEDQEREQIEKLHRSLKDAENNSDYKKCMQPYVIKTTTLRSKIWREVKWLQVFYTVQPTHTITSKRYEKEPAYKLESIDKDLKYCKSSRSNGIGFKHNCQRPASLCRQKTSKDPINKYGKLSCTNQSSFSQQMESSTKNHCIASLCKSIGTWDASEGSSSSTETDYQKNMRRKIKALSKLVPNKDIFKPVINFSIVKIRIVVLLSNELLATEHLIDLIIFQWYQMPMK